MIDKITVIIPAYKPGRELLDTISSLTDVGFQDILVIDDGSGESFAPLFSEVSVLPKVTLLRHEVNRGKGAALKTAFAFFTENRPGYLGVVTADADGQHLPCDILTAAEKMASTGSTVLGVRDFSDPNVPARSKSGNRITCAMFRIFFGMRITDTQTGLRAFPTKDLPIIASAAGDRYEFETNMLFLINRYDLPMEEVKISTVYINDNSSSHFRVVRDSIRIYSLLLKYLASFLISALLFTGIRCLLPITGILSELPLSTSVSAAILGGLFAAILHYILNARFLFDTKIRPVTLARYCLLSLVIAIPAALLAYGSTLLTGIPGTLLAFLVSCTVWIGVFLIHFRLQHKWVFRDTNAQK